MTERTKDNGPAFPRRHEDLADLNEQSTDVVEQRHVIVGESPQHSSLDRDNRDQRERVPHCFMTSSGEGNERDTFVATVEKDFVDREDKG